MKMQNSYNILILSVGRRVELINCFKKAAKKLAIESLIIGGDCSDTAPGLYFADRKLILPEISSPEYIDSIIDACNQYDVSLIIPTIDIDLLLLSRNRDRIEEQTRAKVMISEERVIEICRNKINTQRFLEENGFQVPQIYSDEELNENSFSFPLFIKPVDGSSSINAFKINNSGELSAYKSLIKNAIVQDYIDGDEYTVDAFLDFDSRIITVVPRLRIAVRSGEISKGRIVKDQEIIVDVKRLLALLKPIGHITIQCKKSIRGIEYIEINPRFGGGAPMSIVSGADSCANLYRIMMGQDLKYNENFLDGLLFLRFDSSICLNEEMDVVKKGI